jgi:hypothetical protein
MSADGFGVELIHGLKIKPHYPAEITGFGARVTRDTQKSSRILYVRDILSMKKHLY